MLENETSRRDEADVRARLLHVWDVMRACVERGSTVEGELPGGLRVRRRAAALRRTLEARPDAGAFSRMAAMFLRALAGDREGTIAAVTPDLVEAARVDWQYSWEVASGYALVGALDQAVDWLQNAVTRGFINYQFLSLDPMLERLRGDERFHALMAEARKRHERLRV